MTNHRKENFLWKPTRNRRLCPAVGLGETISRRILRRGDAGRAGRGVQDGRVLVCRRHHPASAGRRRPGGMPAPVRMDAGCLCRKGRLFRLVYGKVPHRHLSYAAGSEKGTAVQAVPRPDGNHSGYAVGPVQDDHRGPGGGYGADACTSAAGDDFQRTGAAGLLSYTSSSWTGAWP